MSNEVIVPKEMILAARWAIQEVDDLFALNLNDVVEDELSSRVAGALYPMILSSNTLIEEQAARIAELEKENHEVLADYRKQYNRADKAEARLSEAVKVLVNMRTAIEVYQETPSPDILSGAISQAKAFISTLGENKK